MTIKNTGTEDLPVNTLRTLRDLIRQEGVTGAARRLHIGADTLTRAAAGIPVRPSTKIAITAQLDSLHPEEAGAK